MRKGQHCSLKTRHKMALSKMGAKNPWYGVGSFTGRHHSQETKEKLRLKKMGVPIHTQTYKELKRQQMIKNNPMNNPEYRKKIQRENNPNWKGGLRGINYLERRRFQTTMQKEVFERDNYTCQLCGIRGGDLQVDHIQSWADYVELRFSMDNCRTLCAKCHYEITFGREMPITVKGWGHNLLRRINP